MRNIEPRCDNAYRLVVAWHGEEAPQIIDFEAPHISGVLYLVERYFIGCEVEVFQNDCPLGRFLVMTAGGHWVINGPRLTAAKPAARQWRRAGIGAFRADRTPRGPRQEMRCTVPTA